MKQPFCILTLLFAVASCGESSDHAIDQRSEVIGGRRDTRHRAVGEVGQRLSDGTYWVCSGTLIDRYTVLTAAHCLYDLDETRLVASELVFSAGGEELDVRSARTRGYSPGSSGDWHDIAILRLADPSDVTPIPFARVPPIEGGAAWVVGFGVTRATGPQSGVGGGTRRSGRIVIDYVDDRELSYWVDRSGACYGDSGGPVLQVLEGREQVAGVTSRGTAVDCTELDIATRVDAYADWIARWSGD